MTLASHYSEATLADTCSEMTLASHYSETTLADTYSEMTLADTTLRRLLQTLL